VTNDGRNGEQTHRVALASATSRCSASTRTVSTSRRTSSRSTAWLQRGADLCDPEVGAHRRDDAERSAVRGPTGPGALRSTNYQNGLPYSLQPALSPSASDFATANNGTEYLFGALEFGKKPFQLDNRLAVWALTNTASLNSTPNIHVKDTIVNSEVYGLPPSIVQPNGPTPLADSLKEHENLIDGGDDRMQAAIYANGHLWGASDTIVKTPVRGPQVGTAYYSSRRRSTRPAS
jgi:hypothetical protein